MAVGTGLLLQIAKCADAEHGLPERISKKAWLLFIAAGFAAAAQKDAALRYLYVFVLIWLCFVAYTDYHTMMVYSNSSFWVGGIGIIYFLNNNLAALPELIVYCCFVSLLCRLGAWSLADAEILIATAPYLIMRADMPIFIFSLFLLLESIVFLCYAILHKASLHDYCAMAPAIAIAAAGIILLT